MGLRLALKSWNIHGVTSLEAFEFPGLELPADLGSPSVLVD